MSDLEVKYVYQQHGEPGPTGKVKMRPEGPGHLVHPVALTTDGKALCGKDISRIRHRKITQRYLPELELCPKCMEAWKQHPASAWARWTRGASV